MKLGKTLAIVAISSFLTAGVALAGGAPTPGTVSGRPDAMVSGRSVGMEGSMMERRMMERRMMKRRMMMRERERMMMKRRMMHRDM